MRKKQLGNSEWPILVCFGFVLLIIWGVARKNGYGGCLYFLRAQYFMLITCTAALFYGRPGGQYLSLWERLSCPILVGGVIACRK